MLRALLVVGALASAASAETMVTVQLSPDGEQLAQQIGLGASELAAQIKARIDDAYRTADIDEFLEEFVDATAFSARGLGADYASFPVGLVAGVAANIAAAGETELRAEDRPTAGLAANIAVMVGLNLRELGQPRFTVYLNGFYRTAELERLDGSILSLGAHVQYAFIPPPRDGGTGRFVRWTGILATGGLELSRWSLGASTRTLSTDFTVGSGTEVTVDAAGQLDLRSTAVAAPIEITTGLQIMWLLTLYAGAGADITMGSASIEANLAGIARADDGRELGTITIAGTGDSGASPVVGRVLVGLQLNLWKVRVFVQLNASQAPAASVAFGLRFVQ